MTVAVVVLAVGATRAEDELLRVQGAPELLRSAVGALQAAVLAGSAAILAAMVGIGMPAAAFRLHNAGSDLPDIPLVVPGDASKRDDAEAEVAGPDFFEQIETIEGQLSEGHLTRH